MRVWFRMYIVVTLNSHPACLGRSHPLLGWSDTEDTRQPIHPLGKTMGGAYGEWTYRAPPGSSRTSGGTAPPPAIPVGQTYTMYIDFPVDGNTRPNPCPHFQHSSRRPPGGVLAPSCSKSAGQGPLNPNLRASGSVRRPRGGQIAKQDQQAQQG